MTRVIATLAAALAAAVALALAPAASAATPIKLAGKVGPGETISLTKAGKRVSKLKAGTYRITVRDLSDEHDFRLAGPGVRKTLTAVGFTGTKSITVKLKKGSYSFFCMPHADDMHGAFRVS
jgi:plastocyanin